jgi:hypothetical protein
MFSIEAAKSREGATLALRRDCFKIVASFAHKRGGAELIPRRLAAEDRRR